MLLQMKNCKYSSQPSQLSTAGTTEEAYTLGHESIAVTG